MTNTDELKEQIDEILTAVFLNGIVAGDEDKSGELLLSVPEANNRIEALTQRIALGSRIDELESMSWHKDHPPEYSGHDSGSVPMVERINELKSQLEEVEGSK